MLKDNNMNQETIADYFKDYAKLIKDQEVITAKLQEILDKEKKLGNTELSEESRTEAMKLAYESQELNLNFSNKYKK